VFSVEDHAEIDPSEQYFDSLDGDWLGRRPNYFDLPEEHGYTDMGRIHIAFEPLAESGTGEPTSPRRFF
jgi:hypothetical protein